MLFYFPGLSKRVKSYVQSCDIYQRLAKRRTADRLPLQPIPMIGKVFSDLEIDILVPELPISRSKKKYVLVMVCVNSKWMNAIPMSNIRAQTIADALMMQFCQTGLPKVVRVDAGSQFCSTRMKAFNECVGIQVTFATPFNHETQELVERCGGVLERMLKPFIKDHKHDWDKLISYLKFAHREVVNASTLFSPAEIVTTETLEVHCM